MKKIVFDGRKEYIKETRDQEADGIEDRAATTCTPEKNGRAKPTKCTIKNAISTMFLHLGAVANLWAECLYAVYDVHNFFVRTRRLRTPEELLTGVERTVAYM